MDKNFAPILYTVKDVSLLLQVAQSFVYKLIETNELRAVKFGRAVRIHPQDLEELIARNRTEKMTIKPKRVDPDERDD
jgi:excisionase family DNA binding protein